MPLRCSPHHSIQTNCMLFYFQIQVHFTISLYLLCDFPLGHSRPTRDHKLKKIMTVSFSLVCSTVGDRILCLLPCCSLSLSTLTASVNSYLQLSFPWRKCCFLVVIHSLWFLQAFWPLWMRHLWHTCFSKGSGIKEFNRNLN